LIKSDGIYRNSAVYALFCGGLESGKLRKLEKLGATSIRKLLTTAHEANIRMELYCALREQGYGHKPLHGNGELRIVLWKTFCGLVYGDRQANEEAATLARRSGVPDGAAQNDDDSDDDDDDDDDAACDPKFFRD
jgi:hypothetical protein